MNEPNDKQRNEQSEQIEEYAEERKTLKDHVGEAMNRYFAELNGMTTRNLYSMILEEIERPLLESTMKYTKNNQIKAAILLGISRGTLRKRLKKYGFLKNKATIS